MNSIDQDHARRFDEEIRRGADPEKLDEIGLGIPSRPTDLVDLDIVAQAMAKKRAYDETLINDDGVKLTPPQTGPDRMTETPPSGPSLDKVAKAMKANAKRRTPPAPANKPANKKPKQPGGKPRLTSRQRAISEGRGEDFDVM